MKSVKQNTIQQSIDRHRITLIESKQRFTKYYSLVLNRERAVQTTAIKRTDLEKHRPVPNQGCMFSVDVKHHVYLLTYWRLLCLVLLLVNSSELLF